MDYSISQDDKVLATLTSQRGEIIVRVIDAKYSSLRELVSALRRMAESMTGMAQLFVRNFTQGWHLKQNIYLSPSSLSIRREEVPVSTARRRVMPRQMSFNFA
ncbi:MAG: hypothetical protein SOT90_08875 [Muribaculaceae bacterium]|nr:hypothetical protein [Muribaculaceae bacterium]MDY4882297.1 hypothetical protein [Muribaculaceae bacterium]